MKYCQTHTWNFFCFLGTEATQNRLITGQNPRPFVSYDVCHSPVLRIFPSTRKPPWSTWHARRSRVSGLGGSPCEQKGGFREVSALGLSAFSASLSADNYSLPVTPRAVGFSGSDPQPQLLPGWETPVSQLPFWPRPSFQPWCPPCCACSCLCVASARAAEDTLEQMALLSGGLSLLASPPVSVLSKFRLWKLPWFVSWVSWVSWGSKLTQVDKERGLIFCLRKWFVKRVLFCFDFQLLIHNMWPHLEFLKVHLWDSEEWVSRYLAYAY